MSYNKVSFQYKCLILCQLYPRNCIFVAIVNDIFSQEMRAKVVEAEAEVPMAMAQALREGKLGVMDYYNLQNVISDTRMREAIAGEEKK